MTDAPDESAGWHPDPAGVHHQRYWDGHAWTARVADAFGVAAVHHIEQDFSPPGNARWSRETTSMPAPSPAAVLQLVAAISDTGPSAVAPVTTTVPPLTIVDPVRIAPRAVAAGWRSDPSGIHRERYWDGDEWSALIIDRNRMQSVHRVIAVFPPPGNEP